MTLACKIRGLPCLRPWDIKFDKAMDVAAHGHVIIALMGEGYIVMTHLGIPCHSCTVARDPQIRRIEQPHGIKGLDEPNQALLDNGNMLIEWSALLMWTLYMAGGYLSIENPWPGFMWLQSCILAIHALEGVILTTMSMSALQVNYDKSTGLMHNMPTAWRLGARKIRENIEIVLRCKVWYKGRMIYKTRKVEPYPIDMTKQYAIVFDEALEARTCALLRRGQLRWRGTAMTMDQWRRSSGSMTWC